MTKNEKKTGRCSGEFSPMLRLICCYYYYRIPTIKQGIGEISPTASPPKPLGLKRFDLKNGLSYCNFKYSFKPALKKGTFRYFM